MMLLLSGVSVLAPVTTCNRVSGNESGHGRGCRAHVVGNAAISIRLCGRSLSPSTRERRGCVGNVVALSSRTQSPVALSSRTHRHDIFRRQQRCSVACVARLQATGVSVSNAVTNLFPFWIALGAFFGVTAPHLVTWFAGNMITIALAVTMLGMGLTIDENDFKAVLQSPKQLLAGVLMQYAIMPLLAFALSRALFLPTPLAVGLILVGCCPGGTASNLVTYIAGAAVALSVVLTAMSTALAAVMTPLLTAGLAGTLVPVPASGLVVSTTQVVLLPVSIGMLLKRLLPTHVARIAQWCPPMAVATVALICASVIGNNAENVKASGAALLMAVIALHAGGFALGYLGSALLGFSERERRTISIEVGMQNSALGCVLALAHFGPASAVPAAISASTHSILGSMLAAFWRWSDAAHGRSRGSM